MSTATTTTKCPEWCTMKVDHIGPDDDGGHSGPSWPNVPSMNNEREGYWNVSVSVGSDDMDAMCVYLEANGLEMTPEQALQAASNLIEAAEWALSHGVNA